MSVTAIASVWRPWSGAGTPNAAFGEFGSGTLEHNRCKGTVGHGTGGYVSLALWAGAEWGSRVVNKTDRN